MQKNLELLAGISLLMLLSFALDQFTHLQLLQYGIVPRQLHSLPNILAVPFLHANWLHLSGNLVGLYVFAALCFLMKSRRYFITVSGFIIIVGGFMVWCFGRPASHIGASGWVFGLWSLCIANAYFDRKLRNFFIALIVVFFYGGMIYGVLPTDARISFEGHLFGAFAGIAAAKVFRRTR